MLCRVDLYLSVDWLKSELTSIEYENYEKGLHISVLC